MTFIKGGRSLLIFHLVKVSLEDFDSINPGICDVYKPVKIVASKIKEVIFLLEEITLFDLQLMIFKKTFQTSSDIRRLQQGVTK